MVTFRVRVLRTTWTFPLLGAVLRGDADRVAARVLAAQVEEAKVSEQARKEQIEVEGVDETATTGRDRF